MKLLLIMPNGNVRSLKLGSFKMSFREAPLTLTTLAALVPPELNCSISLVDESVESFQFETYKDYDLVAISAMTGTSVRAFEIADTFRSMNIKVVMGGVHVTLFPQEAAKHADAIATGYCEKIWPQLLIDFSKNEMKNHYEGNRGTDISNLPIPRRDLQKNIRYVMPQTVMATRGCSHSCDFCTIPAICKGYHKRPVAELITEIAALPRKRFALNDVSIVEDIPWTKKFLKELIPLKKKWGALATFKIFEDKELMSLLQKSGCQYLLIGLESVSQNTLTNIYKGFNKTEYYKEGMKVFHDHGIMIQGCFVFGFDTDTTDVFKQTVEKVNELKIDIPRYSIYTPYPGTLLYKRLEKENRIITNDYSLYDTQHVVYRPKLMSPAELYEGFKWAYRETFALPSICKRTMRSSLQFPITFIGNLAYNIYSRELYRQSPEIVTPAHQHTLATLQS